MDAEAGARPREFPGRQDFCPQGLFLLRHRLLDAASWTYELRADLKFPWWIVLLDEGTRELMFAELRHPLEAETPEALDWSEATRAATHAPPENLTATATHNTVTVTWQRQPDALETWVFVSLDAQDPYNGSLADFVQETGVTGDASVTFEHLPPTPSSSPGSSMGTMCRRRSRSGPRSRRPGTTTLPSPKGRRI